MGPCISKTIRNRKIDCNNSDSSHLEEFNEITIKGKAFEDKAKTIENVKISRDEIEQNSSGSLGDVLNNISGVSSLNTGNAILKPLINGLHSSRVVIINNGVRMQDQETPIGFRHKEAISSIAEEN